ncbi:MAG: hypothetical protein FWE34_06085 [Defluviitaleaceae bacterium]|nr:hypothetical protein [Defluviitaleaceae bacterium]
MTNINDIPEPFREFLGAEAEAQEISATGLDAEGVTPNSRSDMQDLLFLAAILMLCDD